MREDLCSNGGVLDRGDQLHPASAARKAQDVQVESRRMSAAPTSSGSWRRIGLCRRPPPGSPPSPTPYHVRGDRTRPRQGASVRPTRVRRGRRSGLSPASSRPLVVALLRLKNPGRQWLDRVTRLEFQRKPNYCNRPDTKTLEFLGAQPQYAFQHEAVGACAMVRRDEGDRQG